MHSLDVEQLPPKSWIKPKRNYLFGPKYGVIILHIVLHVSLYYIQRKIFFRATIFLYYSQYPNLEGIKDALSYKFRRLTIGQNCCAVCTNEVARAQGPYRCILELERAAQALRVSTGLFGRPPSLEQSERRCLLFVMVWWQISGVRTSPLHGSYSWPAMRGVVFICACALY